MERTWRIGFGNLLLSFQPDSFFISALVYIINFERANKALYELFGPTNVQADKSVERRHTEQIDNFRARFSKYSDEQLNAILEENKLVPEALHAVRQVLMERGKLSG